ncbi:lectin-like [Centropristis striata]|uniref:lectin-like n=1 Tax=Centropristis striata TaxID=184440 RepID=UPI0027E0C0E1|nr:lectin-like [Centropristis striata]
MSEPKSWLGAESYCLFESANLASVHSPDENYFIQSLTREHTANFPHTWIGGHDSIYPGHWLWSDGSMFDYTDWTMDKNIRGNCLMMNYGYKRQWNCYSCDEELPFVCAKMMDLKWGSGH